MTVFEFFRCHSALDLWKDHLCILAYSCPALILASWYYQSKRFDGFGSLVVKTVEALVFAPPLQHRTLLDHVDASLLGRTTDR